MFSQSGNRLVLALLLAAALAARLTWSFLLPSDAQTISRLPDQAGYLEMAHNLLDGQGLVWYDLRFGQDTYAVRMPLYPLFLAACGGSVRIIRIVQAFLDTSTVLAVYLLARRWLTRGPSLFAAVLTAINPFLIYFSALILTETLFTAMLLWAMVLLTSSIRSDLDVPLPDAEPTDAPAAPPIPQQQPLSILWGGMLLAIAVLVRPSGLALPLLLGLAATLANPHAPILPLKRWPLPVGSTMLLLTLLALLPWAFRNHNVLGQWIWTTTNGGFVAYDGFNDQATGASDQSSLSSLEWRSRLLPLTEVQRNEVLTSSARQWALQTLQTHPLRLLSLTASKIARTWSPIPLSQEYGSRPAYLWAALLYSIPFLLLVVLGVVIGVLPTPAKVLLLLPALYFTLIHALSVGSLRYRVPVEPILAVLAAAGAMVILAGFQKPTWRRNTQPQRTNGISDTEEP
ncbi:MAG TPA: hypothetical protein VHP11_01745 [Tepidisphaeraceae bacterium]|nr:hypothetical protein [Tepidisphaeraceae bacterium]